MKKIPFDKINPFKRGYSSKDRQIFGFLRKNYLFEPLDDDELSEFLPFLFNRQYNKGEVIFFRGDPSQAVYVVHKGEVLLNIDLAEGFEEVARFKPGASFGVNGIFTGNKRVYNAICVSETCELYVIPTPSFEEIFEEELSIKAKMMTSLAARYQQYTGRIFDAYRESIGFFELRKVYGEDLDD